MSSIPADPPARGRAHRLGPQRNPEIDDAVLAATRALLTERGYHGTSIEAIAARAGVGRPTVYRRWRTKAHVVHDAVYPSVEPDPAGPAGAGTDPRAHLADTVASLVAGAYALFGAPAARAGVPGLMSDTREDPELRRRLVEEQLDPIRTAVAALLADGAENGTVRPGVDADTVVDALAGAAIFAMSVRDAAPGDGTGEAALAARLTDLLLHGILGGGQPGPENAETPGQNPA